MLERLRSRKLLFLFILLQKASNLWINQERVGGVAYRKGTALLVLGFKITVITSILIHVIVAVIGELAALNLAPLIISVFTLGIVTGGSPVPMSGAPKLKKIKEA